MYENIYQVIRFFFLRTPPIYVFTAFNFLVNHDAHPLFFLNEGNLISKRASNGFRAPMRKPALRLPTGWNFASSIPTGFEVHALIIDHKVTSC